MISEAVSQRQAVRFHGRSYVAFVFSPVVPIAGWLEEIDETLARSPGFFVGRPIVLDLSAVDLSGSAITHLISSLETRNIRVLGLDGVDASRISPSMPPLLSGGRPCAVNQSEPEKPQAKAPPATSLLLADPVRSGQCVVFTEGDVTVLGSVASGAEIFAGGSIHVYGTLRGRVMAGVNGSSTARIYFQKKIEAELLAIDGYYRTAEDIDRYYRTEGALLKGPAQAWLDGDTIRIAPLN
ncbi:MAG TPA: septum site-determining protein MinC [Blastocatellia bacterium]|nr:septum site-determining protein MinC [Blastocatellia bacterium]